MKTCSSNGSRRGPVSNGVQPSYDVCNYDNNYAYSESLDVCGRSLIKKYQVFPDLSNEK